MMLFVEKEINSIVFNEIDFKPKQNYMPDLVLALRDMDRTRTISFALDLKKAPILFILYFRKLKQTIPDLKINLYFRDNSKLLPKVLETYGLKYKNISEYPWELPTDNNVQGEKDPFDNIEGYDDPDVIKEINDNWLPLTSSDAVVNKRSKKDHNTKDNNVNL